MSDRPNQPLTYLLTALLALGAGVLAALLFPSQEKPRAEESNLQEELAQVREELRAAQLQTEELETRVRNAQTRLSNASAITETRTSIGGVEAAVDRWMRENYAAAPKALAEASLGENPSSKGDAASFARELLDGDLSWEERQALWKRVADAGLMEALIAELEDQTEMDPSNPDLRNRLGQSYLQQGFLSGVGPSSMEWFQKADGAFDATLELDGEHWEARFNKAVSLSNWPAFLGKSNEAIQQFEILIDQQENRSPRPGYDQTYFFLGNMYAENGQNEKAQAVWNQGAILFPNSTFLADKLQGN